MKQYKKITKYLRGTAKALNRLALEIEVSEDFDKESESLMSKIGAEMLYYAKTYVFISTPKKP